ncbi:hypothetical protein BpHYR1_025017 [Brachionus plicatilis]|uniref:Uncharacterized protein n=1 Tax=Brachionus plicatilis TaxID=10195 RepID=A0A3M7SNI2_BRAPC|nr:hypothetical protein BpHYR1_025017 [Brachionus plicatilis]
MYLNNLNVKCFRCYGDLKKSIFLNICSKLSYFFNIIWPGFSKAGHRPTKLTVVEGTAKQKIKSIENSMIKINCKRAIYGRPGSWSKILTTGLTYKIRQILKIN